MPCFSPLTAFQLESGEVIFAARGNVRRELTLPCGQCVGCRLERSRRWAMRCLHEAQMHDVSSFVTLTYDDEHCPGSLRYSDFQKFLKRLRKSVGKVRFFMCGEYGERFNRPHYHACLFGVHFYDRVLYRNSNAGYHLYRSPMLEKLWPYGFSSIGDVTFESAGYVARYAMKKVTGDRAAEHYQRVNLSTGELSPVSPEFCHMSLKPGIGAKWIEKYSSDVYGFDRDSVVINGVRCKPPKYYDEYLKNGFPEIYEFLEYDRYVRAGKTVQDNLPERLAAREAVCKARLNLKQRVLEK